MRFVADLSIWASDERSFRLPASTRSMLLRLDQVPEQMFGAVITNPAGAEFVPGIDVPAAVLETWADVDDLGRIEPGFSFALWYGGDVGSGTVRTVTCRS